MRALRDELAKDLATARTTIDKQAEDAKAAEVVLSEERKISRKPQKRKVALLNRQMKELRDQITILNAALDASEQNQRTKAQIFDLGKRLNAALASKGAGIGTLSFRVLWPT